MSSPKYSSRRSTVYSRHGMVASSQPLASEIGLQVLKSGGNAVDAAIAIAAGLNVTEPCSTGIGGDCFLLYYEAATKQVHALNGSGRTPASLTAKMVREQTGKEEGTIPSASVHAITVPGTVAGWVDAIEKWGKLDLAQVLGPAADLADEGFPVSPITSYFWGRGEAQLRRGPHGEEMMVKDKKTGEMRPPKEGEIFQNKGLASVFRSIIKDGKEGFYKGRVAKAICEVVQQLGGVLNEQDLASHKTTFPDPIKARYRGVDLFEVPPNGQGITALLAVNMLEKLSPTLFTNHSSPEHLHNQIEACRLAFADTRWYVTDPVCESIPVTELLSDSYANERLKLIDPTKASCDVKRGTPLASCDTVSFQVVDGEGNAVSMVNSNYEGFGSGIVPQGCGFTLQNRGANLNLDEGHPNVVAPSKRPYHTIIPAMAVKQGELFASFTVMGGFMQPQGHVQIMSNLLDFGMKPQEALDAPRFCIADGTGNGKVSFEDGVPESTIEALKQMGHAMNEEAVKGHQRALFGRGQIIMRDPETGVLSGGSDGRADGLAIGY